MINSYGVPNWLNWQGYLLGPAKGAFRENWAYANLGVLASLVIGFLGTLIFGRSAIRRQEALPLEQSAKAAK